MIESRTFWTAFSKKSYKREAAIADAYLTHMGADPERQSSLSKRPKNLAKKSDQLLAGGDLGWQQNRRKFPKKTSRVGKAFQVPYIPEASGMLEDANESEK